MVKYISQINGGLIMFFRKIFLISLLDCEQYGKNKYKEKGLEQCSSLFKVLRFDKKVIKHLSLGQLLNSSNSLRYH